MSNRHSSSPGNNKYKDTSSHKHNTKNDDNDGDDWPFANSQEALKEQITPLAREFQDGKPIHVKELQYPNKCVYCSVKLRPGNRVNMQKNDRTQKWIFQCYPKCPPPKPIRPRNYSKGRSIRPRESRSSEDEPGSDDDTYENDSFIAPEEDIESDEDDEDDKEDGESSEEDRPKKSVLQAAFELANEEDAEIHNQFREPSPEVSEEEELQDSEEESQEDDDDDSDDEDDYEPPARKGMYCCVCDEYAPIDNFSTNQQKNPFDEERFCLKHTGTSGFGRSYRTPSRGATGLRLVSAQSVASPSQLQKQTSSASRQSSQSHRSGGQRSASSSQHISPIKVHASQSASRSQRSQSSSSAPAPPSSQSRRGKILESDDEEEEEMNYFEEDDPFGASEEEKESSKKRKLTKLQKSSAPSTAVKSSQKSTVSSSQRRVIEISDDDDEEDEEIGKKKRLKKNSPNPRKVISYDDNDDEEAEFDL